jgi:integrase
VTPVPQVKLTKKYIESISPTNSRVTYYDSEIKGLTLRVTPTGVKTYSLIYRNSIKQQKRYTIGKHPGISLAFAKQESLRLLGDLANGKEIQSKTASEYVSLQPITFGEYKTFFIQWYQSNRKSVRNVISLFNKELINFDKIPLELINKPLINNWVFEQQKNQAKNSTINRKLVIIKSAISRAVDFGYLKINTLQGLKLQKIDNNPVCRFLSDTEEINLRKQLDINSNHMLRNLLIIALNTGMRRGELFNLTWGDVDLKLKIIHIIGDKSKSGSSRQIPMNNECTNAIYSLLNNKISAYVFTSQKTGGRLVDIKKSFKTLLDQAGIYNFRFHDLRHTFASKLVMRGVDLNTVRELLGHSDLKMTLRYAHLAPEHKQKAVDLL